MGRVDGSTNIPPNIHSQAFAASIVAKVGPGICYGFTVFNSNVASQFVLLFDAVSVPANGAVPCMPFTVATVSNLGVNYLPGRTFLYGCVLVNSSTAATLTIGAADCFFDVQAL
jgi:hypothetical protein